MSEYKNCPSWPLLSAAMQSLAKAQANHTRSIPEWHQQVEALTAKCRDELPFAEAPDSPVVAPEPAVAANPPPAIQASAGPVIVSYALSRGRVAVASTLPPPSPPPPPGVTADAGLFRRSAPAALPPPPPAIMPDLPALIASDPVPILDDDDEDVEIELQPVRAKQPPPRRTKIR